MSRSEIKEVKEMFRDAFNFFKKKRVQIIVSGVILLIILISSFSLRVGGINNLIDPTTGDYTMSDPDALYFLRLSHVLFEKGNLEGMDPMRSPGANFEVPYIKEILPYAVVFLYKFFNIFSSPSINYVAVISNVVFFSVGLVIFFFLSYVLTRSKVAALLATAFLAYVPAYLFRTLAGVSDHDALGMVGFYSAMLVFILAIKSYQKSWLRTLAWAFLLGSFTGLTLATWAGAVTFLFLIFPIAFLLIYLFDRDYGEMDKRYKLIIFYALWITFYILSSKAVGFAISDVLGRLLNPASILVPAVIGLLLIDTLLLRFYKNTSMAHSKYRILYSVAISLAIGLISLYLKYGGFFPFINEVYTHLINPFGLASETGGRLGFTVSENQQPYMISWMGQTGVLLFYLFVFGMITLGANFAKDIKSQKHRILFVLSWTAAVLGILFSRYSDNSLFNGENFISKLVYFVGFLVFASYFVWLYFHEGLKIKPEIALMFAWMIIMLLVGRSAARLIFVATPFVCFSAAYFLLNCHGYLAKKTSKSSRYYWAGIFAIGILSFIIVFGNPLADSSPGSYQIVNNQAKGVGPVANYQWQSAMKWARENTSERDIFVHWWDYGYLVQTEGRRPSVSDGGHSAGDGGDYNVGRYVLTTPIPETALRYMKTWNVSYLLIDPTDFGKYPAYSRIGGNKDHDRYASPATVVSDPKQIIETSNGTRRVYQQGGTFVDDDISYEGIFLPGVSFDRYQMAQAKAFFGAVILEYSPLPNSTQITFKQPLGVFSYNGKQYQIPLRYLYVNEKVIDFTKGINSTFMIIPSINEQSGQIQIDSLGAGIYMSDRVQKGLFGRLYLMNDHYGQYPTLTEAHVEPDYVVSMLKAQGADLGEFVYFRGLRAPLKVWKVSYPTSTPTHEEFLENIIVGGYGGLDYLFGKL